MNHCPCSVPLAEPHSYYVRAPGQVWWSQRRLITTASDLSPSCPPLILLNLPFSRALSQSRGAPLLHAPAIGTLTAALWSCHKSQAHPGTVMGTCSHRSSARAAASAVVGAKFGAAVAFCWVGPITPGGAGANRSTAPCVFILDLFQVVCSLLSWIKERSHMEVCSPSLAKVDYFRVKLSAVCFEAFRFCSGSL